MIKNSGPSTGLRTGFTLIEAIISFFITILLVSLVFQFSAKFYSNLVEKSRFNATFLENYSAFDHIVRNISQAPRNKENWLKVSNSQVVWRDSQGNKDMGYVMQDGSLYFITGKYENEAWVQSRKSLLSASAKEIKFAQNAQSASESSVYTNTGYISSIVCTLVYEIQGKSYELKRVIGLRDGIIVG